MTLFSVVIAVYNDWVALDSCLRSLSQQSGGPKFEVIVVDDGSQEMAPQWIREWQRYLSLTLLTQPHAGISAGRNRGIEFSSGSILLFVDADCRLQPDCIAALESIIATSPQHNCFQLRLVGNCSKLLGKTEELRLSTIQNQVLQPDGCIRYLNTSGFAVRSSWVKAGSGLFDPISVRGEDTLLLANLIQRNELPLFVASAIVQHEVPRSLLKCFRKDVRSAWLEGKTYSIIASRGIRVRMSNRDRLRMLWSMWDTSKQSSIGRSAWLALVVRQLLSRTTSLAYCLLRRRSDLRAVRTSWKP